jgi:hypothetical protein
VFIDSPNCIPLPVRSKRVWLRDLKFWGRQTVTSSSNQFVCLSHVKLSEFPFSLLKLFSLFFINKSMPSFPDISSQAFLHLLRDDDDSQTQKASKSISHPHPSWLQKDPQTQSTHYKAAIYPTKAQKKNSDQINVSRAPKHQRTSSCLGWISLGVYAAMSRPCRVLDLVFRRLRRQLQRVRRRCYWEQFWMGWLDVWMWRRIESIQRLIKWVLDILYVEVFDWRLPLSMLDLWVWAGGSLRANSRPPPTLPI